MAKIGERGAIQIYKMHCPAKAALLNRLANWDEDKTIGENADAVGMDPRNARSFAQRFNLGYKNERKCNRPLNLDKTDNKIAAAKRLKAVGWSIERIGIALSVEYAVVDHWLK